MVFFSVELHCIAPEEGRLSCHQELVAFPGLPVQKHFPILITANIQCYLDLMFLLLHQPMCEHRQVLPVLVSLLQLNPEFTL